MYIMQALEYIPMAIEKKSKSWPSFWSYQLNCTANSVPLAHFHGKWAGLSGSSKSVPRTLIFLIAMSADYSSEVSPFFKHNDSSVAIVVMGSKCQSYKIYFYEVTLISTLFLVHFAQTERKQICQIFVSFFLQARKVCLFSKFTYVQCTALSTRP